MTTPTLIRPAEVRPPGVWAFLAWAALGAGWCLALATIPTIGIFVLPVLLAGLVALIKWPGSRNGSVAGAISGVGLVPLYIALLNAGGPGLSCSTTATSQECTSMWNPWPFLAVGLVFVAGGLALFVLLRRSAAKRHPEAP